MLQVRLAENLKTARLYLGLTVRQLAVEVGLSAGTISRYESGRKIPSLKSISKIADALDVDMKDLLYSDMDQVLKSEIPPELQEIQSLDDPGIKECPYCKSRVFYIMQRISGEIECNLRFDGMEADNTEMYEDTYTEDIGRFVYCKECRRKIFRYR